MSGTSWYDFRFGPTNAGYYELSVSADEVRQVAAFVVDGQRVLNRFVYGHRDGRVSWVQVGDGVRVDMTELPVGHAPSCAFPLLLPRVDEAPDRALGYTQVEDGSGVVVGPLRLVRDGDWIVEVRPSHASDGDARVVRRFRMAGEAVVEIDWGGPISRRVGSYEEAVAGSPLASVSSAPGVDSSP